MSSAFSLRFPIIEVRRWADRYDYASDSSAVAAGESARVRGWYTKGEFLTVTLWKTKRSRSRCARNREAAIRDATELAMRTADEGLRLGVLTLLHGVEVPTASVLLHFAHPDPYPIIDFRALWSLGVDKPPSYYSVAFWLSYTAECRRLATAAGVSMRVLDRALWQYSKEHQSDLGDGRE